MEITAGDSRIEITDGGRIRSFCLGARRLGIDYSAFLVSGSTIEPQDFTSARDGAFTFNCGEINGGIRVEAEARRFSISADVEGGEAETGFALALSFGLDTRFHLVEPYNVVRLLDSEMPTGREYVAKSGVNLCIVETDSMAVALWSDDSTAWQRMNQARRAVSRHPESFSLNVSVPAGQRIMVSLHNDLDGAVAAFRDWIVDDLGFAPRSARAGSPKWVDDVRLFFTIDMLRSTGEISHDYNDLAGLADDLAAIGCPENTVFYIPGWNGRYDAAYPDYKPTEELGGEAGFQAMMETVHNHGFRVMVHTNPWGLDPFHPQIDDLLKYAVKDKEGRYAGFQTHSATKWGQWAPAFRKLDFASGKQPLKLAGSGEKRTFLAEDVPDSCEAVVTIGGLPHFEGRLSIQLDERVVRSPVGWFTDNSEYMFPFALRLHPGNNEIHIEGPAEALDTNNAWYRIHDCRVPVDPYATWTYPILFGDTANDEWNRLVVGNIGETVDRYGIDAIHCDATEYQWNNKFYAVLKERLPNTAIGGEGCSTLSGLGYYDFSQSHHNMSLTQYSDTYTGTVFQGSLPDWSALDEALSWLDKASPLVGFTNEFTRIYPHLCAADAFVPVGKVCTCTEAVKSPRETSRLRRILDDAPRLNYIPALRVNYRQYGLDDETADYVRSL